MERVKKNRNEKNKNKMCTTLFCACAWCDSGFICFRVVLRASVSFWRPWPSVARLFSQRGLDAEPRRFFFRFLFDLPQQTPLFLVARLPGSSFLCSSRLFRHFKALPVLLEIASSPQLTCAAKLRRSPICSKIVFLALQFETRLNSRRNDYGRLFSHPPPVVLWWVQLLEDTISYGGGSTRFAFSLYVAGVSLPLRILSLRCFGESGLFLFESGAISSGPC